MKGVRLQKSAAFALLMGMLLCITCNAHALAGAELRIELKPQVQVKQSLVKLSDVANISSSDVNTLRRAMDVPLGHAPRNGESVSLDAERIQRWLSAQTGLSLVKWSGAPATEISVAVHEVPGEEFFNIAKAALERHLKSTAIQTPKARFEIQPTVIPFSLNMPAGAVSLMARPIASAELAKRMTVWIDATVDGRFVRAVPIRFEVSAFAPVLVATGELPAGMHLGVGRETSMATNMASQTWDQREVDITRVSGVVESQTNSTQRLKRALHKGEVLTTDHVQAITAVSRGESAQLVVQSGMVALEGRCEVLQDGVLGQWVRVKPATSSGTVLARVTGNGRVELQP